MNLLSPDTSQSGICEFRSEAVLDRTGLDWHGGSHVRCQRSHVSCFSDSKSTQLASSICQFTKEDNEPGSSLIHMRSLFTPLRKDDPMLDCGQDETTATDLFLCLIF